MVIEGSIMEKHLVEAAIPQGLPVSPILFAIHTTGLIQWVDEKFPGIIAQPFADVIR